MLLEEHSWSSPVTAEVGETHQMASQIFLEPMSRMRRFE